VVFKNTSQARGVHQPEPGIPLQGGKFHVYHSHILLVGRVFSLRGKFLDGGDVYFVLFSVKMADNGSFPFPVLQTGDRGSDRDNPNWKNGFPDQAIEKRTFPGLKLPQDGYINQLILLKKIWGGFDLAIQRDDMKLITDFLNSWQ
jgi:hypothetical protein